MAIDATELFGKQSAFLDRIGDCVRRIVKQHGRGHRLNRELRGLPLQPDGGRTRSTAIPDDDRVMAARERYRFAGSGSAVDRDLRGACLERICAGRDNREHSGPLRLENGRQRGMHRFAGFQVELRRGDNRAHARLAVVIRDDQPGPQGLRLGGDDEK